MNASASARLNGPVLLELSRASRPTASNAGASSGRGPALLHGWPSVQPGWTAGHSSKPRLRSRSREPLRRRVAGRASPGPSDPDDRRRVGQGAQAVWSAALLVPAARAAPARGGPCRRPGNRVGWARRSGYSCRSDGDGSVTFLDARNASNPATSPAACSTRRPLSSTSAQCRSTRLRCSSHVVPISRPGAATG